MKYQIIFLLGLFAAINAQFPQLSGSFSFKGSSEDSVLGFVTEFPRYDLYVDISRGLQAVEYTTSFFFTTTTIQVASVNDSAVYVDISGTCEVLTTLFPSVFPFSTTENFWDRFINSTESPPGTFTYDGFFDTYEVIIVNGLPTQLTYEGLGSTISVYNIDSYIDEAPDFTAFRLPADCIQYDCTACPEGVRSSAGTIASSLLLLLAATSMFLLATV
ncbi:hypothetical protein LOD99_6793 [Oopsacas minuta]|uniref:Uncharacterized protein n=1 Tax=Oopsacas minuta TaxID=111878 RepID=A0AAV7JK41_9METZ|nr:hypothetical protein LOD99_6793 [Oopsacas minuta]